MNVLKVSSSGQITLPKVFRKQYSTNFYSYTISGDHFTVMPASVTKLNLVTPKNKKKKNTLLKHLKKGIFKSKHPEITNLAQQIDSSIY